MLEIIDFMKSSLIAGSLIGVMCSYIGVFVVLRRIIFVSIALAQLSALGVALAVFLDKDPIVFSFIFTLAGVLLLSPQPGGRKVPRETVIGIIFALSWAFAILVLSKAAHGEASMLTLVQGNILGVTEADVKLLILVIIPVAAIQLLFFRQFLFTSFDPEMAATLGYKSTAWHYLFYLCLGLVVAVAIKVAGVLLTFSFLLLPAALALLAGNRFTPIITISLFSSLIMTVAGTILSFKMDLPTGPTVVAVGFILLITVSLLGGIKHAITRLAPQPKPDT